MTTNLRSSFVIRHSSFALHSGFGFRASGLLLLLLIFSAFSPPPTAHCDVILGTRVSQADLGGYVVPAGKVLDLGGETVRISSPITCYGTIRNGTIDATALEQFEGAIYLPKESKGATIEQITVRGGSYNGLAKVWGSGARILGCSIAERTGWGVQILGADDGIISGWKQVNSIRGGIYFGDGTGYGTKTECLGWLVEKSTLINSRDEAVFRANTARNLMVRDCFFDNTQSDSGKEAVQPRGRDMTFERCVIVGSTSSGQQPNGVWQLASVKFSECTIYGYNSIEAGGSVTFIRSLLIHRPSWVYNGKTYTLKTPGNGCVVNPQSAARNLPDGKAVLQNCTMDAKELTKSPRRVTTENLKKK